MSRVERKIAIQRDDPIWHRYDEQLTTPAMSRPYEPQAMIDKINRLAACRS
jgi:hypothetical protein